jgi:phosphate transport system protein
MPREQLTAIMERIITLASVVGTMLQDALKAIQNRDHILAHSILTDREPVVNRMETENEETCIEYLALYQPEAIDLRTIVSLLKINNALERIADHVVNIVQRIFSLDSFGSFQRLKTMSERAQSMYLESIDALVKRSSEKARAVILRDEQMDDDLQRLTEEILSYLTHKSPATLNGISALLIARDLERIADIATNIAEDTIYLIQGEITKRNSPANQPEPNRYFH